MDNANTGTAEKSPLRRYIGVKIVEAWPEDKVCDGDNVSSAGYAVKYSDGFQSWCPKQQFEEANRPCDAMTFGHALEAMKQGQKVKLPSWADDVFISVQTPDENSKMTAPYLYVTSRFGCVPWKETMIELFSDDWQIVE